MRIRQRRWKVERLVRDQAAINLNPAWQRGPAWKPQRQALLIDSILRGMDIPKVYLRTLSAGGLHAYDAVDGQQRLRAIWEFRDGTLGLDHPDGLPPIDGHPVAGRRYADLHINLRTRFDNFVVSIADIESATQDEITNLFSRLQMGVSLNPAELRNALGGPMRHVIDAIATSHEFFLNSRIPDSRYKRQDYATHAFAMAAYRGTRDIKAPDLKAMIVEYGPDRASEVLEFSAEIGDALNVLAQVNELTNRWITQKWIFVDLCWLVVQRHAAGVQVDPAKLATAYHAFETRRRQYNSSPDTLIRGRRRDRALDRHLYNYIHAFRLQAGTAANVTIRAAALRAFCPDIDGSP
ncbi:DUF262 domain-containing protein [Mesorhizobium sp. B1-1-8]|uniref:DUF262 domain-containing protein n=1 Tax=Mesorhizobium sp. B1-1-8 TaxID=2589976 RepID=UPI0015E2E3F5|nr:DUF262 domain-containing protein [Mesorhizobium sp. B1-1-8]UCI07323.1 DUF262 domain-containing protein [Mesorhizobium sp. B1-1-8]